MATIASGYQVYNTPGSHTWDVPEGVEWVWVTAIAGGGGGGSSRKFFGTDPGAHGGGSGESCEGRIIPVTPGGTLACLVGAGGAGGSNNANATNFDANVGSVEVGGNSGFGGGDTTVGPIRLVGGYGGSRPSLSNAGMGGGCTAIQGSGLSGAGGSNAGRREVGSNPGEAGWQANKKTGPRAMSGSGGGGSGSNTLSSAVGGGQAPYAGGAAGTATTASGGGGGAASLFGPGSDGGDEDANADTVAAGAYGAGGGGGGGNTLTYGGPTITAWSGADGGDGYVLLTWIAVT